MAHRYSRLYRNVSIILTTKCNRHCTGCNFESLLATPRDIPMETILRALPFLRGAKYFCLTGGEPTLHPDFGEIVRAVRAIAAPRRLRLTTNGSNLEATVSLGIDIIRLNDNYATREMEEWLKRDNARVKIEHSGGFYPVLEVKKQARHLPCSRILDAEVLGDDVYPCCMGPALPGCPTVKIGDDWRERLAMTIPPCGACGCAET